MIFFTRLAHDMRMTCKELGRKVHDVLVSHVIDKQVGSYELAIGQLYAGELNLLIRRPDAEVVIRGRAMQQQGGRNYQAGHEIPVSSLALQYGEPPEPHPDPTTARQHPHTPPQK